MVVLVRPAVGEALAVGPVAGEVHRQGDIPAPGPELGPLAERLPAAAVDQEHRGERPVSRLGPRVVGEDPRRLAVERLALVVDLADAALGLAPGRRRGGGEQGGHVPRAREPLRGRGLLGTGRGEAEGDDREPDRAGCPNPHPHGRAPGGVSWEQVPRLFLAATEWPAGTVSGSWPGRSRVATPRGGLCSLTPRSPTRYTI